MNEKELYTNSILTFAFTNDGRMIVRKSKEGKIDTLPWIFMGYREKGSKTDYEDSIWIMNNIDDYKERIAIFFAYHSRNSRNATLNGFLTGNSNYLLDVGELHKKIANYQIEEMKTIHTPSYIRVNRELCMGYNQNGQQIINRIETRYVVFPSDEDIENFPELEAKELDQLIREEFKLLSDKILLGITGENGEVMESFINQLKSLNKSTSFKKIRMN